MNHLWQITESQSYLVIRILVLVFPFEMSLFDILSETEVTGVAGEFFTVKSIHEQLSVDTGAEQPRIPPFQPFRRTLA